MKRLESRELANADETEGSPASNPAGEPLEMPDEQELIEQVVLEPQDDLIVVRERLELRVPRFQRTQGVAVRQVIVGRQVPRSGFAPRARPGLRRNRTLVQDLGVDSKRSRHVRLLEREAHT